MLVWLILSAVGISAFVWAIGAVTLGWDGPADTAAVLTVALVLPFGAALLWGKQYTAGIVAAIAARGSCPPPHLPVSATSSTSASNGPPT